MSSHDSHHTSDSSKTTMAEILRVRNRLDQLISNNNPSHRFVSVDDMYSESEKKFYMYLSVKIRCQKKSSELKIDQFDARRLKHRETKFPNEV
ncbi:hypothetical protein FDP41_004705 [Naegleria fowleri]|uniref:Uncharacterized protein n=1 Tax=Naegleria fowleri TaxID=5763 RepID=A0A6A5BK70_NAEFO|nr:uncharacterized protein FDP41_005653 [Naegleria fowleri]XP_044560742.1 uncharacterized protein FDP41_004705 [Naegleria fowleri]KAF0975322.1 hypothetical protein FDP41_005653 [Naegleria fowleri]KAF0976029.1 hypothetical protein FDP41_004705 [Naegleria fowleri]